MSFISAWGVIYCFRHFIYLSIYLLFVDPNLIANYAREWDSCMISLVEQLNKTKRYPKRTRWNWRMMVVPEGLEKRVHTNWAWYLWRISKLLECRKLSQLTWLAPFKFHNLNPWGSDEKKQKLSIFFKIFKDFYIKKKTFGQMKANCSWRWQFKMMLLPRKIEAKFVETESVRSLFEL